MDRGRGSVDSIEHTTTFEHQGLTYTVMISRSGGFGFALTGGNSPKGSSHFSKKNRYNLFPDDPVIDDVNLVSHALPVYRKAGDILIEWLFTKMPWRVHFEASTQRKVKVYRWMVKRLQQRLPAEYEMVEYPEGHFEFYRVAENPNDPA